MTRAVRRLVVVVAVMVACAASASIASAEVWTQMTPRPGFPDIPELVGVGASSASDVWAVGENDADSSMPVAAHWDGTAWVEMSLANQLDDYQGGLTGVSALSASDAWAVGWQETPGSGALAVFWNGSDWSVVATPALAGGSRVLGSVSMLTPSDVWAVGYQTSGRSLAEHWNGTRWSVVATPNAGPLVSVKAVSASNVWAIGARHVVEHYNGTKWATVAVPVTSTTNLGRITRIPGTTHLWVVGTDMATKKPVAIYYNGASWKAHNPPGAGALDGVAALSADDVWASGTSLTAPGKNVTFHWTGSAWHSVAPAGLAGGSVENMTRVPGSTQLWAVGMGISSGGSTGGPFAAYYH
ncbi:MAG TPA: hypothetical protein VN615_01765 [Gaiellales bacterium]|nr:hypothetical protein [Gaiellales bacterium]